MLKKINLILLLSIYGTATFASGYKDSIPHLLDQAPSDSMRARILLKASNANPDPELGLAYAEKALSLAQKTGSKALEAHSYFFMACNAYVSKTFDKSHAWFLKAANLCEQVKDRYFLANSYNGLGQVLNAEGEGKKAIEYYRLAKSIHQTDHDTIESIYADMSIAAVLGSTLHMPDSAIRYTQSILPAARLTGMEELVNMLVANIGYYYKEKGDLPKALDYFLKTLPYFEKKGTLLHKALAYEDIAQIYFLMKDYVEAEKYMRLAYTNFQGGKSQKGMVEVMQQIGDVFREKKDFEKASDWYSRASLAKDSLFKSDMAAQIAAMQAKYETEKKDKALALQEAELKQQRLIIYGSIGFLLVILTVSLVLFINFRKIRKLSKALAVQKQELEELNAVKDKLFSAISHDLRSPLGRITNMLYMMQRGRMTEEKLKERTTEFLGAMQQTMQMLDNLLYWATSQMKGLSLNRSNVRIRELVEENLELMQSEAAMKKIEMIKKVEETATALADVNMTRLVLRNLISNAIKFTPENGIITVSAGSVNNRIKVEVSDTGIGMDTETIEALSDSKQVTSRRGTGAEKGFGIGLHLCKDLIEQNGGELKISSEPGKGSTFSFTLPVS